MILFIERFLKKIMTEIDSSKVVIYIFLGFFSGIFACATVLFFITVFFPMFVTNKLLDLLDYISHTFLHVPTQNLQIYNK